jgi:protease IV
MKSFLKYLLATIIGILLSGILIFLIILGIISGIVASQNKTVTLKPNTILYLQLDQPIVDRKPNILFDLSFISRAQKTGLNEILNAIRKAKDDQNITGIHLDLTYIASGIGTIEEIRNALIDFRKSGKFVTVYSEIFTQSAYYLATGADKIYLNPTGYFNFVGLRAQSAFFKNTLKKLDIEAKVIRYGQYKSYGEQYTQEKYSDENREQINQLITSIWDDLCKKISVQRKIPVDKLKDIADNLLIRDANSAYELGFVDSLVFRDQLLSILKVKTFVDESKDLQTVTLRQYASVPEKKNYKGLAKNKIAVIYASGDINIGEGSDEMIGSDKFGKAIREARRDSSIKAIVLRVNSPGGSSLASDVISREISLAQKAKPVIVSMGDVAASGGYYISCLADSILLQPCTITGSIGVVSIFLNTKGLFNKLGITFDLQKTNKHSDFPSGIRGLDPQEEEYWQSATDETYKIFVNKVSEGRHLSFTDVDKIAQGRVWSGVDAIKIGLADRIGGLEDAIEVARKMAGLDDKFRIVELPEQEDILKKLMEDFSENSKVKAIQRELGIPAEYIPELQQLIETQGILTRMPMDINIY